MYFQKKESLLGKDLSHISEALPPRYFTPLNFHQESSRKSGSSHSIPSPSSSGLHGLLHTLNKLSSAWYLALYCHGLLLLHQICPKSSYVSYFEIWKWNVSFSVPEAPPEAVV